MDGVQDVNVTPEIIEGNETEATEAGIVKTAIKTIKAKKRMFFEKADAHFGVGKRDDNINSTVSQNQKGEFDLSQLHDAEKKLKEVIKNLDSMKENDNPTISQEATKLRKSVAKIEQDLKNYRREVNDIKDPDMHVKNADLKLQAIARNCKTALMPRIRYFEDQVSRINLDGEGKLTHAEKKQQKYRDESVRQQHQKNKDADTDVSNREQEVGNREKNLGVKQKEDAQTIKEVNQHLDHEGNIDDAVAKSIRRHNRTTSSLKMNKDNWDRKVENNRAKTENEKLKAHMEEELKKKDEAIEKIKKDYDKQIQDAKDEKERELLIKEKDLSIKHKDEEIDKLQKQLASLQNRLDSKNNNNGGRRRQRGAMQSYTLEETDFEYASEAFTYKTSAQINAMFERWNKKLAELRANSAANYIENLDAIEKEVERSYNEAMNTLNQAKDNWENFIDLDKEDDKPDQNQLAVIAQKQKLFTSTKNDVISAIAEARKVKEEAGRIAKVKEVATAVVKYKNYLKSADKFLKASKERIPGNINKVKATEALENLFNDIDEMDSYDVMSGIDYVYLATEGVKAIIANSVKRLTKSKKAAETENKNDPSKLTNEQKYELGMFVDEENDSAEIKKDLETIAVTKLKNTIKDLKTKIKQAIDMATKLKNSDEYKDIHGYVDEMAKEDLKALDRAELKLDSASSNEVSSISRVIDKIRQSCLECYNAIKKAYMKTMSNSAKPAAANESFVGTDEDKEFLEMINVAIEGLSDSLVIKNATNAVLDAATKREIQKNVAVIGRDLDQARILVTKVGTSKAKKIGQDIQKAYSEVLNIAENRSGKLSPTGQMKAIAAKKVYANKLLVQLHAMYSQVLSYKRNAIKSSRASESLENTEATEGIRKIIAKAKERLSKDNEEFEDYRLELFNANTHLDPEHRDPRGLIYDQKAVNKNGDPNLIVKETYKHMQKLIKNNEDMYKLLKEKMTKVEDHPKFKENLDAYENIRTKIMDIHGDYKPISMDKLKQLIKLYKEGAAILKKTLLIAETHVAKKEDKPAASEAFILDFDTEEEFKSFDEAMEAFQSIKDWIADNKKFLNEYGDKERSDAVKKAQNDKNLSENIELVKEDLKNIEEKLYKIMTFIDGRDRSTIDLGESDRATLKTIMLRYEKIKAELKDSNGNLAKENDAYEKAFRTFKTDFKTLHKMLKRIAKDDKAAEKAKAKADAKAAKAKKIADKVETNEKENVGSTEPATASYTLDMSDLFVATEADTLDRELIELATFCAALTEDDISLEAMMQDPELRYLVVREALESSFFEVYLNRACEAYENYLYDLYREDEIETYTIAGMAMECATILNDYSENEYDANFVLKNASIMENVFATEAENIVEEANWEAAEEAVSEIGARAQSLIDRIKDACKTAKVNIVFGRIKTAKFKPVNYKEMSEKEAIVKFKDRLQDAVVVYQKYNQVMNKFYVLSAAMQNVTYGRDNKTFTDITHIREAALVMSGYTKMGTVIKDYRELAENIKPEDFDKANSMIEEMGRGFKEFVSKYDDYNTQMERGMKAFEDYMKKQEKEKKKAEAAEEGYQAGAAAKKSEEIVKSDVKKDTTAPVSKHSRSNPNKKEDPKVKKLKDVIESEEKRICLLEYDIKSIKGRLQKLEKDYGNRTDLNEKEAKYYKDNKLELELYLDSRYKACDKHKAILEDAKKELAANEAYAYAYDYLSEMIAQENASHAAMLTVDDYNYEPMDINDIQIDGATARLICEDALESLTFYMDAYDEIEDEPVGERLDLFEYGVESFLYDMKKAVKDNATMAVGYVKDQAKAIAADPIGFVHNLIQSFIGWVKALLDKVTDKAISKEVATLTIKALSDVSEGIDKICKKKAVNKESVKALTRICESVVDSYEAIAKKIRKLHDEGTILKDEELLSTSDAAKYHKCVDAFLGKLNQLDKKCENPAFLGGDLFDETDSDEEAVAYARKFTSALTNLITLVTQLLRSAYVQNSDRVFKGVPDFTSIDANDLQM